jgi:hypothetical protein
MSRERIENINQQINALKMRRARLVHEESEAARKLRTRQAIILGNWLLSQDLEMVERIKARLTRPQDRAAFGLDDQGGSAAT